MNPEMSEYCEYMWSSTRGHANLALARSIYLDENRIDPKDKKLAVKTVRAILTGMPNVDLKQCTDEYVTRFLYARKYRTEQAAALIVAYQNQIAHRQDIFGNLTARDPALQRALRAGIPGVLPARDRKGRCVLVILASQWDPIAVPALAVQRAIFLVLEILIQDPRNQHCGFVAVVDWGGFSLRQGGALGAAALRNLISALRGRFPARFKAIHFLSAPLCVQATLTLVKPFLDEKTRNKIHLHGNNLSTLHEHLPTDILPAELGGTGPAFNPGLWAEPVIHSAMKEAEIAASIAQKERESRAKDLVALMQSENGEMRNKNRNYHNADSRIGKGATTTAATELREISSTTTTTTTTTTTSNRAKIDSEKDNEEIVDKKEKEKENKNDEETDKNRRLSSSIVDSTSTVESPSKQIDNSEICETETETEIFALAKPSESKSDNQLSSVDVEVKKLGEMLDRKKIISRSDPDGGLPENEDIESLEIPSSSETNSNEFEMIPSRPSSETSSKESSSFEVDMQVEKIVLRDGANSATLSEEVNLVT